MNVKKFRNKKSGEKVENYHHSLLLTIIIDVILVVALLVCLFIYISNNNVNSYNQNINNITNIVTGKSELAQSLLDSSKTKLKSTYSYCNGKTADEIFEYISLIASDEDEYQLLKRNTDDLSKSIYEGRSSKKKDGIYIDVQYNDTDFAKLLDASVLENGQILYSQRFTNKTDGFKYYGAFTAITVNDANPDSEWFLVELQKGSQILKQIAIYSQYTNLITAICNKDGTYLANDSGFKSNNFYDYLYSYNGLSVEQENEIKASVQNDEDGMGVLTYNDSKGRKSAFVYADCANEWYIVVALPHSDFVSNELISLFPLIIIAFLVVLLVFNVGRLLQIVKQLRLSMERERIANASKSSFLSRMSHEIRTPLNAVIGYMTIAKNSSDNMTKVTDCIAKTEISAKHLLSVINDILDISAIESGKIKIVNDSFNFKSFINSITVMFYTLANNKRVNFDVIFENLVDEAIIGDQMRINQIIINLLNNAIKFTPPGGSVKLKIRQEDIDENTCNIRFTISDTGIGISKEYMDKIWRPFEQADNTISRRYGGSGLGLAITKVLVDMMNGTIALRSEESKGTVFTVNLNLGKTAQPYVNKNYDFSRFNALVVDDDIAACDYAKNLLNHYNVRCSTAYSGEDALRAFAEATSKNDTYNLCLVDYKMENMDGIQTAKRIMEQCSDEIPIIILSAYDLSEHVDVANKIGIKKFLSKPLFKSALFDLLVSVKGNEKDFKEVKEEPQVFDYDFDGAKILLVEDNQTNMEIASDLLSFAKISVDKAWNGEEAVEIFTKAPVGYYKAILMDVQMPIMDGYTATQKIRTSEHPEAKTIPIIAMTANAFEQDIHASLDAGMSDHVSKPIDEIRLYEVLKKYGV